MFDRDILNFNPFEGDRDGNVRVMSDKMVVGRKPHTCNVCFGPIDLRERHRARVEISRDDDKAMTFRFCASCCEAMAQRWADDGRALAARTSIGMAKAREH